MNLQLFLTGDMQEHGIFRPDAPGKGAILTQVKKFLGDYNEEDQKRVVGVWQELFPQYNSITTNSAYREDSWRGWYKEKRICSGRYFERYFTYTIQEGDISDVFFDQFLSDIGNMSVGDAREKLTTIFEKIAISDIIFKIRLWEEQLDEPQSKTLAELLATMSEKFPVEPDEFRMYTTRMESIKIIAQLIANLSKSKRVSEALRVFELTEDMEFAIDIADRIFYKNEKESILSLTENDQYAIKNYFVNRFKNAINGTNFFDILSDENLWRVLIWWKGIDDKNFLNFMLKIINNDATNAIAFVKIFAPSITSWGGTEATETYKGGFDAVRYNSLSALIKPKIIYEILNNAGIYHFNRLSLSQIGKNERMTDSELASVFIQFYERVN